MLDEIAQKVAELTAMVAAVLAAAGAEAVGARMAAIAAMTKDGRSWGRHPIEITDGRPCGQHMAQHMPARPPLDKPGTAGCSTPLREAGAAPAAYSPFRAALRGCRYQKAPIHARLPDPYLR
ncbi:hypothetical protein GCM10011611_49130 [Aliidongia dinghuensis]|uniref:Uncharacterized protein n=1 Tax=Aliidongia dinghuensis TaxID=1867774 RepID=A0A8J2YXK4_9PROT|nr:hypothetical protein GCM10011611_49130 [Aliidongia dinghuensis]